MPLSDHDANLGGDVRTTVRLNYEWRVFMVSALEHMLSDNERLLDSSDYDTLEEVYLLMLNDIYT